MLQPDPVPHWRAGHITSARCPLYQWLHVLLAPDSSDDHHVTVSVGHFAPGRLDENAQPAGQAVVTGGLSPRASQHSACSNGSGEGLTFRLNPDMTQLRSRRRNTNQLDHLLPLHVPKCESALGEATMVHMSAAPAAAIEAAQVADMHLRKQL